MNSSTPTPVTLAFVGIFGITLLFALFAPIEQVIYFFSDDAYYYFQVALNIASGAGSTFDGISESNGYHPLWMLTILPIYEFFAYDKTIPLRIIFILQAALAAGSLYWCWRITATKQHWIGNLGLLLLLIFAPPHILLLNGLETGLLIFWLFTLLAYDQTSSLLNPNRSQLQNFGLGLLLGILVLIRLDSAFILIALTAFTIALKPASLRFGNHIIQLIQRYSVTVIAFCFLIIPYFIWNQTHYGHITPVSGAVKSSFPQVHISPLPTSTYPYLLAFGLTVIWVLIALFIPTSSLRQKLLPGWRDHAIPRLLPVLWLGCLLHLLWTTLFMQWAVFQWHFAAYVPVLVVTYCLFFSARIKSARTGNSLVLATAVVLVLYSSAVIYDKGLQHMNRYDAALWAKQNSDADDIFAIHDSGVFAYFSERPTINLDGLINSFEYQEIINNKQLPEYFAHHGLKYIANAYQRCEWKNKNLLIQAYRGKNYERPVGYYYTTKDQIYTYRSEPFLYRPLTGNKNYCFSIWQYQPERLLPITDLEG